MDRGIYMPHRILKPDTGVTRQSTGIDAIRAVACIAIVLHHWLLLMPYRRNSQIVDALVAFSGDFVYLFFIISGLGLTLSHLRRPSLSWKKWALKRFEKIILPFWVVVTATFALAHVMRLGGIEIPGKPYSPYTLMAHLSFARNFFPDTLTLNGTLWFMPVLIGLYALFPGLMWMIRKFGVLISLSTASLTGYASKMICGYMGHPVEYQHALPLFYLPEFVLGVLLGCMLNQRRSLLKPWPFPCMLAGVAVYLSAEALPAVWDAAWLFDDTLRAIGLWLIMWPVCCRLAGRSHKRGLEGLLKWSRVSFIAYLIHCPLIIYLLRPAAFRLGLVPSNAVAMAGLGVLYVWLIFLLAKSLHGFIEKSFEGIRSTGGLQHVIYKVRWAASLMSESIHQPYRTIPGVLEDLAGHTAEQELFRSGYTAPAKHHRAETA